MSKLRVPYQCLEVAGNLLVAARGSNIDLFSLEDQSLLSTWKYPSAHKSITGEASQQITQELPGTNSEPPALPALDVPPQSPPAKRRKLSDGSKPQNPCEEGKGKKGLNDRSDSIAAGLDTPAIITLAVARGGKHVIAATGEDKCIWVFEIVVKENGKHYLKSVSQRSVKGVSHSKWYLTLILKQCHAKTALCLGSYGRRLDHNHGGQIWGCLFSPFDSLRSRRLHNTK